MYLNEKDRKQVDFYYKQFLIHLKSFLQQDKYLSALDCSKKVIHMLHSGLFSMDKKICFDEEFKYLFLYDLSDGVQVSYGVCCCRHASAFLNDLLRILGFDSSLKPIFINEDGNWHKGCSLLDTFNHVVVFLKEGDCSYLVDPQNKFIFRVEDNQDLTLLNLDIDFCTEYDDINIQNTGMILKKYYHLQSLGIEHVYDYSY